MSKPIDAPHPNRETDRERLEASDRDYKVEDFFVILNNKGERKYLSNDQADAEQRLKEMATGRTSIGEAGEAQPALILIPCLAIETDGFEEDGPESRTRGKRSGKSKV
jgi:hypothetical protein